MPHLWQKSLLQLIRHAPEVFADERVYELILEEFRAVTGCPIPPVRERWTGTYSVAGRGPTLVESPSPRERLVMVTIGNGASIGFAVGEQVVAEMFD